MYKSIFLYNDLKYDPHGDIIKHEHTKKGVLQVSVLLEIGKVYSRLVVNNNILASHDATDKTSVRNAYNWVWHTEAVNTDEKLGEATRLLDDALRFSSRLSDITESWF